jgi:rhodanese-related sulfurtransferase
LREVAKPESNPWFLLILCLIKKEFQMKDKGTKPLVIVVLIFVAVLAIGWISTQRSGLEWTTTTQETLDYLLEADYQVLPEDVAYFVEFEEPGYVYVDLRNPYEFIKGNVATSVNIPRNQLLEEPALEYFNQQAQDSMKVVLIHCTEAEATGPWMLLKQLGYDNIKVMKGGWSYYANESLDPYDMPDIPKYEVEEPAYDFAAIMELMKASPAAAASQDAPEVVIPQRKKKKSAVEGGC